ncbi:Predicted transcriptional regulator YheO, contains PAS and DNA-binding HTH domains [Pseudomonas cedrina]|uniref:DNA-binding protein n=2 Tax=Pseudomonas cedrina TaxID=651740 RepID=A0A1V2K1H4_PSECE|nr:PAS domain-containing protein [Pseudomonas cedrina]ONH51587.1 DNA-binding protein [Pseudomonas cedrina subsp. cedrina]SDT11638.1 Predicted transcriptional regulator YheO, contains PAS and DNA-binding HTH domains [Pseudomonas cedrina]
MKKSTPEQQALISQLEQIAEGLSKTFSPFCEVVLHDLRDPSHAILAIHNNLSGRQEGDPATELGLARIADPAYPQVIANYPNQFKDGRAAKSTSIGIKDSTGRYVAALCMNIDLTVFRGLQVTLEQFASFGGDRPDESLEAATADAIRARIDQFAARISTTPRALKTAERRALLQELKDAGQLEVRKSMETIASYLGVSRTTVYADIK